MYLANVMTNAVHKRRYSNFRPYAGISSRNSSNARFFIQILSTKRKKKKGEVGQSHTAASWVTNFDDSSLVFNDSHGYNIYCDNGDVMGVTITRTFYDFLFSLMEFFIAVVLFILANFDCV